MTDIMKLATDYAQACYHLANPESYDAERAEEARAALQSAIEALRATQDRQSMQLAHDAVTIGCLNDKVMALQAENGQLKAQLAEWSDVLEAMQRQEPVIDSTVLHQFASPEALEEASEKCTEGLMRADWKPANGDWVDLRELKKIHRIAQGADTMTLYRKKPVVIEAIQWDGSWDGKLTIEARWPELRTTHLDSHPPSKTIRRWGIGTLEGHHQVGIGDYIIKGVKGEFYPCKPDIFKMTYEVVE